jgi:DNA uptake protein ComE-like DNA-binding protein
MSTSGQTREGKRHGAAHSHHRINLNAASEEELSHLPGLSRDWALEIVRRRPIKSWEELKSALNLDQNVIDDLKEQGVTLAS